MAETTWLSIMVVAMGLAIFGIVAVLWKILLIGYVSLYVCTWIGEVLS